MILKNLAAAITTPPIGMFCNSDSLMPLSAIKITKYTIAPINIDNNVDGTIDKNILNRKLHNQHIAPIKAAEMTGIRKVLFISCV